MYWQIYICLWAITYLHIDWEASFLSLALFLPVSLVNSRYCNLFLILFCVTLQRGSVKSCWKSRSSLSSLCLLYVFWADCLPPSSLCGVSGDEISGVVEQSASKRILFPSGSDHGHVPLIRGQRAWSGWWVGLRCLWYESCVWMLGGPAITHHH